MPDIRVKSLQNYDCLPQSIIMVVYLTPYLFLQMLTRATLMNDFRKLTYQNCIVYRICYHSCSNQSTALKYEYDLDMPYSSVRKTYTISSLFQLITTYHRVCVICLPRGTVCASYVYHVAPCVRHIFTRWLRV